MRLCWILWTSQCEHTNAYLFKYFKCWQAKLEMWKCWQATSFCNFVCCDRSSLHHQRPQLVRQRTFSHFQSAQCHRIKKVIQNFLGNKFDNFKILIACVHSDRTCLSVKRVPSKVILALEYLCVVPLPLNSLRWPYLSVWFKWHKPNFCWHLSNLYWARVSIIQVHMPPSIDNTSCPMSDFNHSSTHYWLFWVLQYM